MSCAKPNYQDRKDTSASTTSSDTCALNFKTQNLCLSLQWEKMPTQDSMGSFLISFYAPETPAIAEDPVLSPFVILWMPSMGHGSSPVTVQKVETGLYRASRVFFVMPGEWDIHLQLKDQDNHVVDETIQSLSI
jgi:hypothetical protein